MLIGLLIVAASIAAIIGGAVLVNRLTLKGGYDISSSEWRREVVVDSGGSFGCEDGREEEGKMVYGVEEWMHDLIYNPIYASCYCNIYHGVIDD